MHHLLTSHFKVKSPVFRSWTSGNLGYWFSVIDEWICTNCDPKGISTGSRERCWPQCFPSRICVEWACTALYLQISLLIDALVPAFYEVSSKVPSSVASLFLWPILILFCPQLRDAFARKTIHGPQEVCGCLICYIISHVVVFRLKYFPGWPVQHLNWLVKLGWGTRLTS